MRTQPTRQPHHWGLFSHQHPAGLQTKNHNSNSKVKGPQHGSPPLPAAKGEVGSPFAKTASWRHQTGNTTLILQKGLRCSAMRCTVAVPRYSICICDAASPLRTASCAVARANELQYQPMTNMLVKSSRHRIPQTAFIAARVRQHAGQRLSAPSPCPP